MDSPCIGYGYSCGPPRLVANPHELDMHHNYTLVAAVVVVDPGGEYFACRFFAFVCGYYYLHSVNGVVVAPGGMEKDFFVDMAVVADVVDCADLIKGVPLNRDVQQRRH
jgi:hypothetical protein